MYKELTPRQHRFVDEYLISLNATQAAIKAGYSEDTAAEQSCRLLRNVKIKNRIKEANKMREERTQIDQDYVLKNLKKIVEHNSTIEAYTDKDGNPSSRMRNAPAANKALELLGKHLQMFSENMNVHLSTHEEALRELEELYED